MNGRMKTTGAVAAVAAGVAFAGYAIGSQAGDGIAIGESGNGSSSSTSTGTRFAHGGPGGGPGMRGGGPGMRGGGPRGAMLEDLAQTLGVDEQKLQDALEEIRDEQNPPSQDPRERFAAGLAQKLGIDQAKVEEVLEAQRP